jgi:hypothetical protein
VDTRHCALADDLPDDPGARQMADSRSPISLILSITNCTASLDPVETLRNRGERRRDDEVSSAGRTAAATLSIHEPDRIADEAELDPKRRQGQAQHVGRTPPTAA